MQWQAERLNFDAAASTFHMGWCHPMTVAQNYMLRPDLLALSAKLYLHHNFVKIKNGVLVVVVST